MTYFDFAIKNKIEKISEKEKKTKSPFDKIFSVFNIINTKDKNFNESLDTLFKEYEEGDFSFITWAINHYLAYNNFLRENVELFLNVKEFLKDKKYVYFFVEYCIKNNIKFPKFMQWYKSDINNEIKTYSEFLIDKYKLKEEELKEFLDYMSNKGISLKEICLNLNFINE